MATEFSEMSQSDREFKPCATSRVHLYHRLNRKCVGHKLVCIILFISKSLHILLYLNKFFFD